ncbi:MAG: Fe-S-binding domain-containing protein, partial [Ignavibacteriae bacterium]|nr:Fe-S-binding domain-containing protein [Ignavibacteriota bacterium]
MNLLSIIIFLPLVGALAVFVLDAKKSELLKQAAFIVSLVTFAISLLLWFQFDSSAAEFQFQEQYSWIPGLNISYLVGIDGMSLLLIVLTTFLTPLALLGTWNSVSHRLKEYLVMILLLEVGMIGVFAALDLFLFYVFWEAMLIPMYFI